MANTKKKNQGKSKNAKGGSKLNMRITLILFALIPLVIVQLALFFYVLIHIFKHDHYKHGNRVLWLVIVLLGSNFVGPILYLILGKEEE